MLYWVIHPVLKLGISPAISLVASTVLPTIPVNHVLLDMMKHNPMEQSLNVQPNVALIIVILV